MEEDFHETLIEDLEVLIKRNELCLTPEQLIQIVQWAEGSIRLIILNEKRFYFSLHNSKQEKNDNANKT